MATYFWVLGTGTWDGASTANWAASTGGAAGAGPPTAADDVVFDANSGTGGAGGTVNPLINAGAACRNVTVNNLNAASAPHQFRLGANFSPAGVGSFSGIEINRFGIVSSVVGTTRTLTFGAAPALNFVDFYRIAAAGGTPWTGTRVGNRSNNSGITFDAPVTRFWVAVAGGNYRSTASWSASSGGASGASIPIPQDTAIFDANSITSTGRTITMTAVAAFPKLDFRAITNNPTVGINSGGNICGDITFGTPAQMTLSMGANTYLQWFPTASSATLITGGQAMQGLQARDGAVLNLGDAVVSSNTNSDAISVSENGAQLITNGNSITCAGRLTVNAGCTLTPGAGASTFTATGPSFFNCAGTVTTPNGLTCKATDTSATTKTFAGGGQNYGGGVWLAGAGTGVYQFTGSNTFGLFQADANRNLQFTAGTTQTAAAWQFGGGCTIGSITAASHTLQKSGGGHVSIDSATISRSNALPAGSPDQTFFATNSTDGGNNTGWTFSPFMYTLALDPVQFNLNDVNMSLFYHRTLALDPVQFNLSLIDLAIEDLANNPGYNVIGSSDRIVSGSRGRTVTGTRSRGLQ